MRRPVLLIAASGLAREVLPLVRESGREVLGFLDDRHAELPRTIGGAPVLGAIDDADSRLPVFSFTVPGLPVGAIVKALDDRGVAVRAGDMAALPLLKRFGIAEAVRASCYLYTTISEVDRLVDGLRDLQRRR